MTIATNTRNMTLAHARDERHAEALAESTGILVLKLDRWKQATYHLASPSGTICGENWEHMVGLHKQAKASASRVCADCVDQAPSDYHLSTVSEIVDAVNGYQAVRNV